MSVKFIDKREMVRLFGGPYFGYTSFGSKTIYIRRGLPKWVEESVFAHERRHLMDLQAGRRDSLWVREARAWWDGFKAQPVGFLLSIIMSLTPARLWLYTKRIVKNF